jgi:hypothetical protein
MKPGGLSNLGELFEGDRRVGPKIESVLNGAVVS